MKFAREFKAAIQSGDYPEEWCQAAIPYPTLKKCLNKIRAELQDMGLDADTLRQLLAAQVVSSHGDQIPLAKYKFDVGKSDVRTHFTIFVDLEDGVVVDASLSPASRAFLQKQADMRRSSAVSAEASADVSADISVVGDNDDDDDNDNANDNGNAMELDENDAHANEPRERQKSFQRVEVTLTADSEFFGLIYRDMAELERISQAEQASITDDVVSLGKEVEAVARPELKRPFWKSNKHKEGELSKFDSDLSTWREVFELYLDAQVFFSTREYDRDRNHGGVRSSVLVARQLDWFQDQVRRRNLLQTFHLPASRAAFQNFLQLNKRLYLNMRFRELNQKAQIKILKKFDKVTALGVSTTFPVALSRHHYGTTDLLVDGLARDVCARIAQDVVAIVPRLEDYTCPVCLGLAWLPVRLSCKHVFCVRCVIKMQRDNNKHCPLCRGEVVMEADLDNLDKDLEKFLKLYFRQEAKEKQKSNELERGIELFGQDYKPASCAVM